MNYTLCMCSAFRVEFGSRPAFEPGWRRARGDLQRRIRRMYGSRSHDGAKVIKEGGRNYGAVQRAGPVTFATVILKRGMTSTRHLWRWFEAVNRNGGYAHRLAVKVTMMNSAGKSMISWKLEKAMPIKFKAADLNAKGTEVGIEELHSGP